MIWMLLPCMHSVPGPLCLHVNTNVFTNQLFIRSSWESQHRHWTVKDVSHDQLIGATKPGKLFVSYSAATQQSFISLESKYDSIILNRPQLYLCHSWLPVICWKGRAKQSKSLIRQTLKNQKKKKKKIFMFIKWLIVMFSLNKKPNEENGLAVILNDCLAYLGEDLFQCCSCFSPLSLSSVLN